jgi:carboxymethylenebutenolidase
MTANGFAAAVQPISPDTIHTPSEGLIAGDVDIPCSDGFRMPAYRAMPKAVGDMGAAGAYPLVLVVQEIFGLHEYIKDVCRRIALRGYVAVAPQTFARAGDPAELTEISEIRPIVNATPDATTMADLDSTVDWAVNESDADPNRLGITGFCWGGRTVWLYAAHSSRLKAGVAWYGRLAGDISENQPQWPVDVARSLNAPVLGLYGGDDASIPADVIERMRAELRAVNSRSEIIVYPGAPHGFHSDYRPSYRPADALDGERRLFEWLARYGVK